MITLSHEKRDDHDLILGQILVNLFESGNVIQKGRLNVCAKPGLFQMVRHLQGARTAGGMPAGAVTHDHNRGPFGRQVEPIKELSSSSLDKSGNPRMGPHRIGEFDPELGVAPTQGEFPRQYLLGEIARGGEEGNHDDFGTGNEVHHLRKGGFSLPECNGDLVEAILRLKPSGLFLDDGSGLDLSSRAMGGQKHGPARSSRRLNGGLAAAPSAIMVFSGHALARIMHKLSTAVLPAFI
jgi:hypothetical protein